MAPFHDKANTKLTGELLQQNKNKNKNKKQKQNKTKQTFVC